ncbi:pyocin knob domain-containing protein [Chryseobacterium lactis]|uniref:pyocin knob domain-containing protein n=1 Tax=Chryseobacterium lactis TaxID=1241981 RepID=UPI00162383BB|nr:pyocin knob domain-containing protein [Chryseobacterium lactis]
MDVKYAYYNTSKGYRVTGGTAAQFLKADGSLDNTEYINRYSEQTINSTKTIGFQNTIYSRWDRSSVANPQMGPISLLNLALQGAYPLYGDEEFRSGFNGIGVYNNYGNGNVTMTREAAANLPNRSGMQLRFNYNGGGATPGLGGFIIGFIARANAIFIQKFMAKLPVGYSFNNAENYMGDNASVNWLTSKAGTGKWETYVRAVICGTGTNFSNGGHVYVAGPDTAMEFCLAFAEIYEVNSSVFSRIKEACYVKNETIHFNGAVADLITVGDAYAQKKLLSTSWDGTNGDQLLLRVPGSQNNGAYLRYSQNGTLNGNIGSLGSDNLTGGQIFSPQGNTLYLGNSFLPNTMLQSTTNTHFNYGGAGTLYTFNVNGIYSDRNINFNQDNSGINFFDGGKIYKKSGGGIYINRGTNGQDPRVETADGSQSWRIFHEGNFNATGYVTQTALNAQLNNYAALGGVQTFTNTNTFSQSPVIPAGTLGTHAVNLNQLNTKANGQENAMAVGFSSGNVPTADGGAYPYMYHNSGLYVALATQSYAQSNFVNTPNGTSVVISGSNLNSYLKTGFYRGAALVNAPSNNSGWWYVTVETHDATWVKQTATAFGSGNTTNITYQRTMSGGVWSNWAQVWTAQELTTTSIQQWNNVAQYGLRVNAEFTTITGSGLFISDNYTGSSESGIIDVKQRRFLAAKRKDYYYYGSGFRNVDGLNFNLNTTLFGMGRDANDADKLSVSGSVKASDNFKSEDEDPNTVFIPDGRVASLKDEIVNDQSDSKYYALRLDPHEYNVPAPGYFGVDDKNRLIHIIGEQTEMVVGFKEVYPKQQIVIYNFDYNKGMMGVEIYGKRIYDISPFCFVRLYVTESGRVIAEREQPCKLVW